MVPQQAQRLRWEDDVDIFFWCDKGRVFDDESILFLPLPAPALADAHPSLPFFTLSPAHLLLLFILAIPDDLSLMGPSFRLFCISVWLVPLPNAIKPLNNWVRPGHCSLVIATLDSICIANSKSSLIGNCGWSSYRWRTLDASSSCILASLDVADLASSVFLSALLGRSESDWTVSGLGSVPEVDDIFLWVNCNALLCTLLSSYVHTYPHIRSSWAHSSMRLRYIIHLQSEIVCST